MPAVNILDDLCLRAVIAAAVAASSPMIIQISVKTVRSIGTDLITTMFRHAAADVPVPVALHLDHCPDRAVISDVVRAGLVVGAVRRLGPGPGDGRAGDRRGGRGGARRGRRRRVGDREHHRRRGRRRVGRLRCTPTTSTTLAAVAERTGVDLLAPQLGTAHGEYKAQPVLLPERVRELAALTDRPIVLHGGTGLSADDFATFIAAGVSKINISTGVKVAYMRSAETHLAEARAT